MSHNQEARIRIEGVEHPPGSRTGKLLVELDGEKVALIFDEKEAGAMMEYISALRLRLGMVTHKGHMPSVMITHIDAMAFPGEGVVRLNMLFGMKGALSAILNAEQCADLSEQILLAKASLGRGNGK